MIEKPSYVDEDQTWLLVFEDTYTRVRYMTMEKGNYLQAVHRAKPRVASQADVPETRLGLINQAQEGEVVVEVIQPHITTSKLLS